MTSFEELARSTEEMNGAQLKAVCVEAGMVCLPLASESRLRLINSWHYVKMLLNYHTNISMGEPSFLSSLPSMTVDGLSFKAKTLQEQDRS